MSDYENILNTFISCSKNWKFGDIILFQEYKQQSYDNENKRYDYKVGKPKLVSYLKSEVCDQTIGFDYIEYKGDFFWEKSEKKRDMYPENTKGIHVEWDDYINILGYWKSMPTFRELLSVYRKYETKKMVNEDDIFWEESKLIRYKREQKLKRIL